MSKAIRVAGKRTAQESRACQKIHKARTTAEEIEGRTGGNEIYKAFQRLRQLGKQPIRSLLIIIDPTVMGLTCLLECVLYE
jgi:hypothetical protein